jgi:hypothetical protein
MSAKVVVPYEHDPRDLSLIELAVTPRGAQPSEESWVPAYRDTVDGKRLVFARFASTGTVWIRDRNGVRKA